MHYNFSCSIKSWKIEENFLYIQQNMLICYLYYDVKVTKFCVQSNLFVPTYMLKGVIFNTFLIP